MTKSDMVVSKTFSARWLMALMFSLTACIGFLYDKLPSEAFMSLVGAVVTAYFLRSSTADRKNEGVIKDLNSIEKQVNGGNDETK